MKRLIIICEEQTERDFCQDVLYPYFLERNILVEAPLIKHSNGGIVPWSILKKEILANYERDLTASITTLIDYYGIRKKHQFPNWEQVEEQPNKNTAMDLLEKGMQDDLNLSRASRFIPYVQLHEFEGLLFINQEVFEDNFPPQELIGKPELEKTLADFSNPEMINNGSTTAPSKRLMRIIDGYSKTTYGSLIAQEIGLAAIRAKCPRFDAWIDKLSQL